jgi:hypothetical protein
MKKVRTAFFAAVLLLSLGVHAQNMSTTIKVQAMDLATAFMKNDFNTFVKFMHPNIVAFAGGKEQMRSKMDSAYATMKQFGVSFKRYWIGTPGPVISYKGQLQAVLPESTTIATPLGDLTVETSIIVLSSDKGKSWTFIDTNVYQADKLKNILPDLSPDLVIPPRKKPKMAPAGS